MKLARQYYRLRKRHPNSNRLFIPSSRQKFTRMKKDFRRARKMLDQIELEIKSYTRNYVKTEET